MTDNPIYRPDRPRPGRRSPVRPLALALLLILPHEGWTKEGEAAARAIDPAALAVIDGDTIRYQGERWRLEGFDAPEIEHARCTQELARGIAARSRLLALARSGAPLALVPSGRTDRYGRSLARLLVDGEDAGEVLVREGLARPYAGGPREGWC
ncbi:MAG TPA: thermonuclease family protein [Xanthobacteraceae bacterium]|nr:thermonuclease family protein [Xanthobacteraceae bacterium]